jgi:transcriptional regulator with XRE-family HTH domain
MVERIRLLLETRQLTPTQFADAIGVARPIVSHVLSGRNKPSLEVVQRILAAMPELSMPWLLNGTGDMLAPSPNAGPMPVAPTNPPQVAAERIPGEDSNPAVTATPNLAPGPSKFTANQVRSISAPVVAPNKPPVSHKAPPAPIVRPTIRRFVGSITQPHALDGKQAEVLGASVDDAAAATPEQAASAFRESDNVSQAPLATPSSALRAPSLPDTPMPGEMPDSLPSAEDKGPINTTTLAAASSTAAALFGGSEKPIRRIVIFYRDGSFADYQPE